MSKSLTVWLLQTGEPLHIDAGNPRPMRAINLANHLVDAGHKVVLWSSAFYHQEKRHRSYRAERHEISPLLEIRLIPSPGYKRNISPSRFWDHIFLAHNLKRALKVEKKIPDVAFVGYPPIETAAVMTNWLSTQGVPSLLDVKDQWPSLFLDAIPGSLRPFCKLVLWPYISYSKKVMRQATGLSSMTDSFLQWGLDFIDRVRSPHDSVFPLTSPTWRVVEDKLEDARMWLDKQGIYAEGQTVRLVFIGSHSPAFDFIPVLDAARSFAQRDVNIQFVICGAGGVSAQLRSKFANIPNVFFPGWVDRAQIEALAERSHAALIPYRNIDNFTKNLPNKVIDALSLGLPILSSLQGEVAGLISSYDVGLCYGTGSEKSLVQCIETLMDNPALRKQMSMNALNLYKEKFSFDIVYDALVKHLEMLSLNNRPGTCFG